MLPCKGSSGPRLPDAVRGFVITISGGMYSSGQALGTGHFRPSLGSQDVSKLASLAVGCPSLFFPEPNTTFAGAICPCTKPCITIARTATTSSLGSTRTQHIREWRAALSGGAAWAKERHVSMCCVALMSDLTSECRYSSALRIGINTRITASFSVIRSCRLASSSARVCWWEDLRIGPGRTASPVRAGQDREGQGVVRNNKKSSGCLRGAPELLKVFRHYGSPEGEGNHLVR